ncbi:hypothetical protein ACJMK2_020692 [Sinanodonta woodiana]|uniref:Uncharacterized protein n=1 Tax=Sinanodonta woodiana TaxID=1069815 RepID=A0ABD3TZZ3_SINWO
MRLMPYMFQRPNVDSKLSKAFEDVTNDVLMLRKLYHRGEGGASSVTKGLLPSQRLPNTHPSHMRRNNKPVHSILLSKQTMSYLKTSINLTRLMGSIRQPLDRLTNLTPKKMSRFDSSVNREPDGDQSR